MLEIKKARFVTSVKDAADFAGGAGKPEIAVSGKSNAGKSSLINSICNNFKLAYVSKQPGKTRLVNYFLLNDMFYLVDLPGYGFAKVSKAEKYSWADMMEGYFAAAKNLAALLVLMDIRREPGGDDLDMINWANYYGVPFAVVATKADKIAKSKRINYTRAIQRKIKEELGIGQASVIAASSLEKRGKEAVLEYIRDRLERIQ
jgi:GTP-binding protein